MKAIFLPSLLLLCGSLIAQQVASGNAGGDVALKLVPVKVHSKFLLENPDVKAQWKAGNGVFTARYINPLNNMGYIIVYDSAGTVLQRERELENQEYPGAINDYFNREYPGEGFVVWSSVDSAGRIIYYSDHHSRIHRFDRNGNLVNPKKAKLRDYDSLRLQPR